MSDRSQFRRWVSAIAMTLVVSGAALVPVATAVERTVLGREGSVRAHPMVGFSQPSPAQPSGFRPTQIIRLYGLPASSYAGAGQTIAIVDAYNDPTLVPDLATFDTRFGLTSCLPGCLTEVDQNGGSDLPGPAPTSWDREISLDVEWAHALAPAARILLVEAASDQLPDLLAAENYAGAHAGYVSNSWGTPEFAAEPSDDSFFQVPGVSYFAAAGDVPGQIAYPAISPSVVSLGGDEHTVSRVIPWPSTGGGCSAYEQASPAQADVSEQTGCQGRAVTPDASAVATPIPAYLTGSGWWQGSGNSFATILWAAAAADSGQVVSPAAVYADRIPLRSITGGALARTGMGDLEGPIPMSLAQRVAMVAAATFEQLSVVWRGFTR